MGNSDVAMQFDELNAQQAQLVEGRFQKITSALEELRGMLGLKTMYMAQEPRHVTKAQRSRKRKK